MLLSPNSVLICLCFVFERLSLKRELKRFMRDGSNNFHYLLQLSGYFHGENLANVKENPYAAISLYDFKSKKCLQIK